MATSWEQCGRYVTKGKPKNTNPTARALDTWMVLKTITTSGTIHQYRKQLKYLGEVCKVSKGSLLTRIKWLEQHNLVHVEDKRLHLHGYNALGTAFDIDIEKRITKEIFYDTTDKITLAEKLLPLAIERMKDACRYMYNKKIDRANAREEIGNHAIAYGAKQEKMGSSEYFRHSHLVLQALTYSNETAGQSSFHIAHDYTTANPDVNLTQATLGRRMGYSVLKRKCPVTKKDKSASLGAGHLQRRLAKKGLITVQRAEIVSDHRARKDESIFHHRYGRKSKQTIWYRPNQLTVNYDRIFLNSLSFGEDRGEAEVA